MFELTRYLYIVDDVKISLLVSVLEKDYNKALFWVSEMYHSGYQEEVVEYVDAIYSTFFQKWNPRFHRIMRKTKEQYKNDTMYALTVIIKNLTVNVRQFSVRDFVYGKGAEFNETTTKVQNETNLWILPTEEASKKYALTENATHYTLLSKVCLYSSEKRWGKLFGCKYVTVPQPELLENHRSHWLYHASVTPLWKQRITEYRGVIEDTRVIFPDEDLFEEFHNRYDYEIDEQTKEMQSRVSHIEPYSMCDANEFYKKYEPGLKVVKSKRVNKKRGECK